MKEDASDLKCGSNAVIGLTEAFSLRDAFTDRLLTAVQNYHVEEYVMTVCLNGRNFEIKNTPKVMHDVTV